ncbi:MAG: hypothetical protein HUK40_03240 [Desulfobacter sp.]|nr:hypothetical protein [Desulfobacter sp.]
MGELQKNHEEKWKALGRVKGHGLSIKNKRDRANIDRWIKKETDLKYDSLKRLYASVSKSEMYCVISIVSCLIFYLIKHDIIL